MQILFVFVLFFTNKARNIIASKSTLDLYFHPWMLFNSFDLPSFGNQNRGKDIHLGFN